MYKYVKQNDQVLQIGEVLNDDGSVQMTLEENLANYLDNGYEESTQEEWEGSNGAVVESEVAPLEDVPE